MTALGRIQCQIPARGGSKRVPAKNLRLLDGKPMLGYAIEAALQSEVLPEVFVNTDSDDIGALAREYGVQVYRRPDHLGSDTTTGDDFTADFITANQPDTLVMVSPVCPLVTAEDVRNAVEVFGQSDCDTLITCTSTHMQTFCESEPVNIELAAPLAPSQENPVVHTLNWAVTVWDAGVFMESYKKRKSGYLGTHRTLVPINPAHAVKISNEADFKHAELMLRARRMEAGDESPVYWRAGN